MKRALFGLFAISFFVSGLLFAEEKAADHVPFNPRVWSSVVIFTVH